jgi:uncharacterized protein YaiI (UPF0178 family)
VTTDTDSTPLNTGQPTAPEVLVDADACPVKEEIYKVAGRHGVPVTLVANSYMRFPRGGLIRLQVVDESFDAADDWIAEAAHPKAVVITADILLAQRCLDAGGSVLAPTGKPFTDASIGGAVATRGIMADLRASVGTKGDGPGVGGHFGGPAPFSKADRSRFLQALHEALEQRRRSR